MSALAAAAAGGVGVVRAGARLAATGATAALVAARARGVGRGGATDRLALRAGLTVPSPARQRARVLRDGCRAALRLHGVAVDVQGGLPPGPLLLACNHVSWLDPLVVAASVPCAPISKLDVRGWPLVGGLAGLLGVIFHARGDQGSGLRVLRQVEVALAAGLPVLNFPEGTTTDGAGVLRFHKGLFGLAARLGVPAVPVALRYQPAELAWTGDATFLPHYLRLAARGASRVALRFGEPVLATSHADAAEVAAEVRARVAALLEGLP
ncbi:MAG: 1-acyl-sn-glycerol-3-phosphate acyltransferase [Anaeromyxobacter sp.]|nr:1-acyl-sn-glycerol-3-phosphate acyltransferase [Anaeromyxobacter sp.]MBL0275160.1 1-acyl-sn-glycerol-3-phosphate acyltransferase [Anaeromyxobacter sp.]